MRATEDLDAVIVGGGPRAVATALRTAARVIAAGISPARLAIVDALAVGSGATWLIDQPAQYLNNTQADATTVHPDDSTRMTGPAAPGPDLIDWARRVRADGGRSEEHTSELQSRGQLVCRLLLEKKKHATHYTRQQPQAT